MRISIWVTFLTILSMPMAFAEPLKGTLVVVNKLGDDVSFIDLASQSVVATLPTGKGPHELAISQDGKWAVTTDYVGGNSLTVFDIGKMTKVRTIDLSDHPKPHGILFLPNQMQVAVSSEGSNRVVIADIHTGKIDKAIDTTQQGSHMVALPGDGKRVYTTNMGDHSVSELDVASGKITRTISTPKVPEAITINRDGSQIWIGSNEAGLVTILDSDNLDILKQWQDYTWPYRILLNQTESYAVIPDLKQNTLDIVDVANKTRLKRLEFADNPGPKGVFFHPDDSTLFLSLYNQDRILVIDIPSGNIAASIPAGDGPDGIGYSHLVLPLKK